MAITRWRPTLTSWPSIWEDWGLEEATEQGGLDIYETEDEIVVEAPVPGISKEDVDVTIEGGVIRIKAETEETAEEGQEKKYYQKRAKRSFYYTASLPSRGKWDEAEAEIKDGVVHVNVPKKEEEKSKKIEVK